MAIKGKKRSKGGRKGPARAPKPKLVVRKPPLVRRTWFRITAVLVLVASAGAVTWGVLAARRSAAEEEAARREVTQVGVQLEAAITTSGGTISTNTVLYQGISATMGEIVSGEARPNRIEKRVADWTENFETAKERLEGVETDRGDLRRATQRIDEGFDRLVAFIEQIPEVATLEGRELRQRALELQTEYGEATGTVSSGWVLYTNERIEVGLDEGGQPGQLPPGQEPFPPGQNPFPPGQDPFAPGGEAPVPAPTG